MKGCIRMGLFMNTDMHPTVFKNNKRIQEPNQTYFEYNHFSELMLEQQRLNETFHTSIKRINMLYQQQSFMQKKKWAMFENELEELKSKERQFKQYVMGRFKMLEENLQKLHNVMENEIASSEEAREDIRQLRLANDEILNELNEFQSLHDTITQKLNESLYIQKNMTNQLANHKDQQEEVVEQILTYVEDQQEVKNKVESQEALLEKVLRQMDHFRSILYERSSYLADKIDDSYQITSSYVYQLLRGNDKPYLFVASKKSNHKEDQP